VRRAIAFSELLQHPNLVRMMGTWESDDIIFVGECHTTTSRSLGACSRSKPLGSPTWPLNN
jgi:hypothetical protein